MGGRSLDTVTRVVVVRAPAARVWHTCFHSLHWERWDPDIVGVLCEERTLRRGLEGKFVMRKGLGAKGWGFLGALHWESPFKVGAALYYCTGPQHIHLRILS